MAITPDVTIYEPLDKGNRGYDRVIVKATMNIAGAEIDILNLQSDILDKVNLNLKDFTHGRTWIKITPNMASYTDEQCSVRWRVGVNNGDPYTNLGSISATSSIVRNTLSMTYAETTYTRLERICDVEWLGLYIATSGTAPDYTVEVWITLWNEAKK